MKDKVLELREALLGVVVKERSPFVEVSCPDGSNRLEYAWTELKVGLKLVCGCGQHRSRIDDETYADLKDRIRWRLKNMGDNPRCRRYLPTIDH